MTETAESSLNHEFYAPSEGSSLHEDIDFDTMNMITTTEMQKDPQSQVDGIEILVNMAKTGKIDPWNVDIVDILQDDWNDEEINTNNVISLDEVLQRRTSVRLNRSRMVNLKDLIKQLQFYEELDRKQALKNAHERAKRRVRSYARLTPDDIVNLAHDEYIEKSVEVLHENLKKIFETQDKVELTTLTLLGLDKISAYIALLFLTAEPESDIDLYQEEFYGELYAVPYKKSQEEQKESA